MAAVQQHQPIAREHGVDTVGAKADRHRDNRRFAPRTSGGGRPSDRHSRRPRRASSWYLPHRLT
jgi:hypothetical protein